MPFVQGKCENCGGILEVDSSLKAANCPYCGVAYIVQDSINNYNTTIHNVESLHADVITVMDESSSEARCKAGFAYVKIGKYDLAEEEFNYVIKVAPQNHLGWLGLVEALTHNYTKRIKSSSELRKIDEYAKSALTLAPNGTGIALLAKWNDYKKSEEEKNKSEYEELSNLKSQKEDKIKQIDEELIEIQSNIEHLTKRNAYLKTENTYNGIIGIIAGSFMCFIGAISILSLFFFKAEFETFVILLMFVLGIIFGGVMCFINAVKKFKHFSETRKEQTTINRKLETLKKELKQADDRKETISKSIKKDQEKLGVYS